MAFQLGVSLLDARNGHSLYLRNLGVNFIENSIKAGQIDRFQMQTLKNQFWTMVFCEFGTFDAVNEKVLIKEKVAGCMAILACKLWLRPEDDPSQWNDFFEQGILESVLKSQLVCGNEHLRRQEFALLTISQLVNLVRSPANFEDTTALQFLTEERRLQLHSGLEIVLPPFTEWLYQNFPSAVASNVSSHVLNAAVSCFQSFCNWINNLNIGGLETFLQASINALFQYESDDVLTTNILDTLQTYFTIRPFQPAELKVLEFYLVSLYPQICQLLQRYSNDQDEGGYQKLKALIGCYLSIGNRYMCRKYPLITKNVNDLISLFIALGNIPSLSIYLDLLDFFTNILKCDKIPMKPHLPQLFLLIAGRLGKGISEDRRSIYNAIDFEESSEFKQFRNLARARSGDLLKALTAKFSDQILEFSYNALGTFIQGNRTSGTWNSYQWEGLLLIEEYITRGLEVNSATTDKNSIYLLHLQLLMIHSPISSDTSVLERWIACVKNFTALQGTTCPADDFRRSVEGLFNLAISTDKPDSIRSLAAISLLKLADANSSLFLPLLEPLLAAVSPLLNGPTGSWERRLFSELILIFLSQPSISPDKQMILFSAVADPLVDLLKNAKNVLLSVPGADPVLSLMKHVGFDELNCTKLSSHCRKFTSDLNLLLSTLQLLFKRIGPLVQSQPQSPVVQTCLQVLDELVGFLMLMIQCVHKMGTKGIWMIYFNNSEREYNHFYPKMQEFLEIGIQDDNNTNSNDNVGSSTSPLVHIAGWTRHYRQTCYLVLGSTATCFKEHFFALPHFAERFMNQPLSSLESLNLSDWSLLIKLLLKPVLSAATGNSFLFLWVHL